MKTLQIAFSCFAIILLTTCSTSYRSIQIEYPYKTLTAVTEGSNVYFSKYETSNLEYRRFLNDIKQRSQTKWESARYDSIQWTKKFPNGYFEPMQRNYHSFFFYDNSPVVNISQEAAEKYCEWLTREYREKNDRRDVIFRLPTVAELSVLRQSADVKYDSDQTKDYSQYSANLKYLSNGGNNYPADGVQITDDVSNFRQNKMGFCSVVGNVAELAQDGQAYNGGWDTLPSEVEQAATYTAPDPRIGLRVVIEVLK